MVDQTRREFLGVDRPPLPAGIVVAALAVAVATGAIYPLKSIAPAVSLSVVYLPAVLLVSAYWGLALGLATSLASAAAFNFFHIPPVGRFTISDSRNWVALAAFTIIAAVVSTMADVARTRALEAERGHEEAGLAAALARELLAGTATDDALRATARRVATGLAIPSAAIELGEARGDGRRTAIPLCDSTGEQLATLVVPSALPGETISRLRDQVAPALAALVGIALHRDSVQAEAVHTAALRQSDELKTALLRAVSHDLRTPLTAILTAGHALGAGSLTEDERQELSAVVVEEGDHLSALIDKLLDLSRLQAGRAEPSREWVAVEDVLLAARDALGGAANAVRVTVDPNVPPLLADAAQLERVFANLLENALRYAGGAPVSVKARRVGATVRILVVDQGPGIPAGEQQRIFEPFYRGPQSPGRRSVGSGLGLAVSKGFVEANGGRISVESLPGQGTSLIVTFPYVEPAEVAV
jgi:two-component system, OmpR family, sensor histidine kinase KdpD